MITTLLFDFSYVLLFPKDSHYMGKLNALHKELSQKPNYVFFDHYVLNNELLDYLKNLKEKYILAICTTGTIQNVPEVRSELDKVFSKVFSSADIGYVKSDSEAYLYVAKQLGVEPKDILFIDDQEENVLAAKTAGLSVIRYTLNKELFTSLS